MAKPKKQKQDTPNPIFQRIPNILLKPKKQAKQLIKQRVAALIGNQSLPYINSAFMDCNFACQNRLNFIIKMSKNTKKLLNYLAILAVTIYNSQKLQLKITFKSDEEFQDKPQVTEIPLKVLQLFRDGAEIQYLMLSDCVFAYESIVKLDQFKVISETLKAIRYGRQILLNVTLDRLGKDATLDVIKEFDGIKIQKLNIIHWDVSKQMLSRFQSFNFEGLRQFFLEIKNKDLSDPNVVVENQQSYQNICQLVSKFSNLQKLQLKIQQKCMNFLTQSINKLKYLSHFTLKSVNIKHQFTQQNLLDIIKYNIFLSEFNIQNFHLPEHVRYLFRLIRQRKRVQDMQTLSIEAMEKSLTDLPFYFILNVLEVQKVIII